MPIPLSSLLPSKTVSPKAGVDQVTPGEGRVELFGGPFDSRSRYKWLRAVVVPGGDIYGIPAGADDVVKIRLPNEVRHHLSRRTWPTGARSAGRVWLSRSTCVLDDDDERD